MSQEFDLVVIGGGSGGVRTARWSAGLGAKVALIEKDRMGGTCVVRGCIPKKIMSMASHFKKEFEAMKNYGWNSNEPEFDWKMLKINRDAEVARLSEIYQNLLVKSGVQVFKGLAQFKSQNEVIIQNPNGNQSLKAKNILIATGSRPLIPNLPGKELLFTSDDFFNLESQAKSVALVGAGYIGVELASIYLGLGSETHLVAKSAMTLNHFDHELSHFVTERMKLNGMKIHLNSELKALKKVVSKIELELRSGDKVVVDQAIISVGRRPNTESLDLEKAGVELHPDGRIKINEKMQTTTPGIYALGDVANKMNLTPVATAEAMWLAENLFGKKPTEAFDYSMIPTAVFSDPPLASVGLTEEQCKSENRKFRIFKTQFRPLKHTISKLDVKTFMKLIVEDSTDRVLGCHMAGEDAPEIMQGFAVAMKMGATKKDFDRTIGIHPSAAEEFVTLRTPS